jgi:hypothetical protein
MGCHSSHRAIPARRAHVRAVESTSAGLLLSGQVVHELLGIPYYWVRGLNEGISFEAVKPWWCRMLLQD